MSKVVVLGDIATVKNGKSNTQDAKNEGLYDFFDRSQVIKKSDRFIFDTAGTIIPGEGKDFNPRFYKGKFDLHQRAYVIIGDSKIVDDVFLYYAITANKEYLARTAVGSTVKSLRKPQIEQMQLNLPDLPIQKKIADILWNIDKKIELNTIINETLEQICIAIFNKNFIKSPDVIDWDIITLGQKIHPKRGKSLTSKNMKVGEVPVISGGLRPAGLHNEANTVAPVITVSASGANAGFVALWGDKIWSADSSYIDSKVTNEVYFYYIFLKINQGKIFGMQTGAAQPHIYPSHLELLEIPDAPDSLISELNSTISPLLEKITNNNRENNTLASTRDKLLPRLISGKINVN